jgi:hypothetical protein
MGKNPALFLQTFGYLKHNIWMSSGMTHIYVNRALTLSPSHSFAFMGKTQLNSFRPKTRV